MAKPINKEIIVSDLEQYIATADDFRLEIDVYRMCLAARCEAFHGGTYRDPITGKDRQFDIRAHLRNYRLNIRFAIECKCLRKSFPLLVSRVPRTLDESYHEVVISRPLPNRHFQEPPHSSKHVVTKIGKTPPGWSHFQSRKSVGKAITQVGRDSKGDFVSSDYEFFEKWAQAIASSYDLFENAMDDYKEKDELTFTVIQPVVVIGDETLWTIDYDNLGNKLGQPVRQDCCEYFLGKQMSLSGNPAYQYTISHLLIFTRSGIESFLKTQLQEHEYWEAMFHNCESLYRKVFPEG